MSNTADFGVIGLGVMGSSLALNIEEKGHTVAVFDIGQEKAAKLVERAPEARLLATQSIDRFVAALPRPRRILLMVPAGDPVDASLEALAPHLDEGDIVIDGGNEFYTKTEARQKKYASKGFKLIGMGVSGGEEGARHGPSMMPGGDPYAYKEVEPVLTKIAAQVSDGPCVAYMGPGGAGHYVKMVHNGIEYGDMQLIAESYNLLKNVGGLSNAELADVFSEWNQGELSSFLIEITADIFRKKDTETDQDLVDVILDTAKMKGTGSWTVQEAVTLGSSVPTIASSVDARILSGMRPLRLKAAEVLQGPKPSTIPAAQKAQFVADTRAALYAAKACSYAQGLSLLQKSSEERNWSLNLGEIVRIWKAGCIIRAAFLGRIQEAYQRQNSLPHLLMDSEFASELAQRQDGWRRTVACATQAGVSIPTLSASLGYYDALRSRRLPASLTQAQRDYFGAHTYQRLDREGVFHTQWK